MRLRGVAPLLVLLVSVSSLVIGVASVEALSFSARTACSTGSGSWPLGICSADFNGDGYDDLATANWGADTIGVLLSNGDGTFAPVQTYSAGTDVDRLRTIRITAADFDRDGNVDLLATNLGSTFLSLFLGKGDGTFAAATPIDSGPAPNSMAIADFNHDGCLDIAVTDYEGGFNIMLGRGNGTFAPRVFHSTTGSMTFGIASADWNADGDLDLVVVDQGTSRVGIYWGDGTGAFTLKSSYYTLSDDNMTSPMNVVVADFTHDGKLDAFVTPYGRSKPSCGYEVLTGDGDTGFVYHRRYMTGAYPWGLVLTDFNNDGIDDVGMSNAEEYTVTIGLGDSSTWSLTSLTTMGTGAWPESIAAGDFDGDRRVDFATSDGQDDGISVFFGVYDVAPSGSMSIDDGAAATNDRVVQIHSSIADAADMRVRDAGGTWSEWQAKATNVSWTLTAGDGVKTVEAEYRNPLGTISRTDSIVLDTVAPTTSDDAPTGWQVASPVTVTLTSSDGTGSGVAKTEYEVDDAVAWSTGTTVPVSGDGVHSIRYRSIDAAGNTEDARSATVKIDTSTPTIGVSGNDSAWHAAPVTLTFAPSAGASGVAGVEYKIGDGSWTEITENGGTYRVAISTDGEHAVDYRTTNGAGTRSAVGSCTVKIDTSTPTIGVSGNDSAWHAAPVTLTFAPSAGASGVASVEYKIGDGSWTEITENGGAYALVVSDEGKTTVGYRAISVAGVWSATGDCTVKIDSRAPTLQLASRTLRIWRRAGGDLRVRLRWNDAASTRARLCVRVTQYGNQKQKLLTTVIVRRDRWQLVSLPWKPRTPGRYRLHLTLYDQAGRHCVASAQIVAYR